MHVTGEQLGQLTGIAAVLRFPLPEIEQDDESSDEVRMYVGRLACCRALPSRYVVFVENSRLASAVHALLLYARRVSVVWV